MNFPKKFIFDLLSYYEGKPYTKEFKSLEGFNFLNGVSLKNSIKRENKNINILKSENSNFREIIVSGSVQIRLTQADLPTDALFKFIKTKPTIKFRKALTFNYHHNEEETINQLIMKIDDFYNPEKLNKSFPFVDYYKIIDDLDLEEKLWKEAITGSKNTYVTGSGEFLKKTNKKGLVNFKFVLKIGNNEIFSKDFYETQDFNYFNDEILKAIEEKCESKNLWGRIKEAKVTIFNKHETKIIGGEALANYFESFIEIEPSHYIFINNNWYLINEELRDQIDKQFQDKYLNKPRNLENAGQIKPHDVGGKPIKHEAIYNFASSNCDKCILIDAMNITLGGVPFEVADFIKVEEDKIILSFVKIGKSAHSLSDLFGQVLNSKKQLDNHKEKIFDELIEKFKDKNKQKRNTTTFIYNKYYWKDEDDRLKKLELLNKIKDDFFEKKIQYNVIFVRNNENSNKDFSPMAKSNLLSFVENLESNLSTQDEFRIIEDYWNVNKKKYDTIEKNKNKKIKDDNKKEKASQ